MVTTKSVFPSEKNGPFAAKAGVVANKVIRTLIRFMVLSLQPCRDGVANGLCVCCLTKGCHDLCGDVFGNLRDACHCTGADFVFVAVDQHGRPRPIPREAREQVGEAPAVEGGGTETGGAKGDDATESRS